MPNGLPDTAFLNVLLHFDWGWNNNGEDEDSIKYDDVDPHVFEDIDFSVETVNESAHLNKVRYKLVSFQFLYLHWFS